MRIAAPTAIRLPSALSFTDGALIEPLAVGLYGVRQSSIDPDSKVLILGGGSVALCAVWWARILGASKIVVASRSQRRAEMALAMGVDAFVQFGENEGPEITETLGGQPDIVLECIGKQGFLAKGMQHVRTFGEVISMGFCTSDDSIVPAIAAFKAVTFKFAVGYTRSDFERSIAALDHGHADTKMLVSAEVPLDQLPQTLTMLRDPNDATKIHVVL